MLLIHSEWSFLVGEFGKVGKDGEETGGAFFIQSCEWKLFECLLHGYYEPLLGVHD